MVSSINFPQYLVENLKKKEKSSSNLPVCSFQSQLLIRLLHTRIRMSRNEPSRLLCDNLETAAKVISCSTLDYTRAEDIP